jgi:DNA-binding CsgD family transcriptional regulator
VDPLVAIGRTSEVRVVERFLTSAEPGRVLVLSGEPGIGKSTLWEAGVEFARSRGLLVLSAAASEAEAHMSFAGLADLLDGVDSEALAGLPAPSRQALEVAVGRAEPGDRPAEAFAIAAGVLGLLRLLSAGGRVVVAVDDLPWLDGASAVALVFAARRLSDEDVRFFVSRRSGAPSELERVLVPTGVATVAVGPLSFGATSRLLADRLGRPLPRRVLRQLFEMSGGNPLFSLELGRAVGERGVPEIGAALPMPSALDELFGDRVVALAPEVRRALLAVSLSAGLSGEELAAVVDPLAIEDARTSGVLSSDGHRVRASHPLLAAAASVRSSARERRDVHLALAAAVRNPELRIRHRAMAAVAPDTELAEAVSLAAAHAAARGAVQDAAELAAHALRLSAEGDPERDRRLLALARYLIGTGDHLRATQLLAERLETLPAGATRAEAHLLLGEVAEFPLHEDHLARAIADGGAEPGLRAQAQAKLSELLAITWVRRIVEAEELAQDAVSAATSAGHPEAERRALVALGWARVMRGCPIDDLVARSTMLGADTLSMLDSSLERPMAARLVFRGELAPAREGIQRHAAAADVYGDVRSVVALLTMLCEVALRRGHAVEAARAVDEWDHANTLGLVELSGTRDRLQAMLAALRGEPGPAFALAGQVLEADDATAVVWDRLEARRAIGLAALLERQADRAIESLGTVWEHTKREGVEDPGAFPVAGDLVEALADAGRVDIANGVIRRLRRLAAEQQHPWGLATLKRSAAVVELVAGYGDSAAADLAQAAIDYQALGLDFDRARALLFLGRVERRAKKRAAARQSLEQARSAFEQLGCPGWAQVAAEELNRISGRRRAAGASLTPSEQRVAELVASGLSNKEVAGQLFISVYTVEAHLSNVYTKLGIRSRAQLARQLHASV